MKTIIRFLLLSLVVVTMVDSNAQVITVGNDTTICPGQSLTLTATVPSYSSTAPTQVGFGYSNSYSYDDGLSGWLPIGFTFNYYGNNYTQVLASSNTYITFSGTPNGYSPWSIGVSIPNAGAPLNAIMSAWQDTYPGYSNTATQIVRYKTVGTAPNRIFVIEYLDIPMFSCWSFCYGTQIKLYETTNVIETHIAYKTTCPGWNSGVAIHGIQNATGTIAHVVPGRNYPTVWSCIADGKRFTPNSATSYTITNIPFNPSYMPNTLPPASITWLANGTPIGTGNTVTVTPTANTTYVARLNYSSCSQVTSFADTMRVFMGSLPLTTSPNTAICIGDSTQISVSTTAPGTTDYSWAPAATLLNANTSSPTAFPTTQTIYTVTATNGLCSNTAQVTVGVNPLPTINFNSINPYICPGNSVTLIASGGTTYDWFMGSNLSSTNTASTDASPLVNTQYGVIVTDANGCVDTAYNNVLMYTPPTITAATSAPSICYNYTMGLAAAGGVTYQWSPATGLDFTDVANPNATLTATTTYTVTGTDANGCVGDTTITVVVDPLPLVDFSADTLNGCEPVIINFKNLSSIPAGSISSYAWAFEGHGSSSLTDPTVTYPQDGLFDVTLVATSDMGCVDSLTISDMIHIYNIPTAGFYATPQPTTIGDPEITFTNTSSGDVTVWNWDFGGQGSSSYSSPIFSFTDPGQFEVVLIVETQYGCSDTVSDFVQIDDLSEIFIPNGFTPNDDGLNDTWFPVGRNLNTKNLYIEVHVFNRWGTRVYRSTTSDKPWNGHDQNIGEECPEGTYTYRVIFVNEQGKEKRVMGHINLIR